MISLILLIIFLLIVNFVINNIMVKLFGINWMIKREKVLSRIWLIPKVIHLHLVNLVAIHRDETPLALFGFRAQKYKTIIHAVVFLQLLSTLKFYLVTVFVEWNPFRRQFYLIVRGEILIWDLRTLQDYQPVILKSLRLRLLGFYGLA
jgi:hypothetical protein